ncbi:MAG: hypothetical protein JNM09_23480 [Blastocatellia bacterium]|nr:hypothetical protein [Blastocatellia bacterium]
MITSTSTTSNPATYHRRYCETRRVCTGDFVQAVGDFMHAESAAQHLRGQQDNAWRQQAVAEKFQKGQEAQATQEQLRRMSVAVP